MRNVHTLEADCAYAKWGLCICKMQHITDSSDVCASSLYVSYVMLIISSHLTSMPELGPAAFPTALHGAHPSILRLPFPVVARYLAIPVCHHVNVLHSVMHP